MSALDKTDLYKKICYFCIKSYEIYITGINFISKRAFGGFEHA